MTKCGIHFLTFHAVSERHDCIGAASPWMLPWHIIYKGQHYCCCDIAFSKFIKDCLPCDFYNHRTFDNAVLLMEIADYFQRKRR